MAASSPISPIDRWALDPEIVHLNHGSFGGCLRRVLAAASAWRDRIEAAPMRFFVLDWQSELDRARAGLAAFVGADPERTAFVPSATTGVAIALRSIASALSTGDEIIVTDHGYRACTNQVVRLAAERGLRVVTVEIPLPFDPDRLVDDIARAITPRTRCAVLDHVTSPTALVLPVERICAAMPEGVTTIVDGAHAPGQLALDVFRVGATYYTGNCHKWLCAPHGCGFLVAAPDAEVVPVVTSHGASPQYGPANRLHAELDWSGTYDPTPHLTVPTAIAEVAAEAGSEGWSAAIARNHTLVLEMRDRFVTALGTGSAPLAPDTSIGSMIAIPIALPAGVAPLPFEKQLLQDGWEVPIVDLPTGPIVRLSAHIYNHADQADALGRELHGRGVRLRAT